MVDGTRRQPRGGAAENWSRRDGIRAGSVSGPWRSAARAAPAEVAEGAARDDLAPAHPAPAMVLAPIGPSRIPDSLPKPREMSWPPRQDLLAPPPVTQDWPDAEQDRALPGEARSARGDGHGALAMTLWIAAAALSAIAMVVLAYLFRPDAPAPTAGILAPAAIIGMPAATGRGEVPGDPALNPAPGGESG